MKPIIANFKTTQGFYGVLENKDSFSKDVMLYVKNEYNYPGRKTLVDVENEGIVECIPFSDYILEALKRNNQMLRMMEESKPLGWVGATTEPVFKEATEELLPDLYTGDLKEEKTNTPGALNPHFTIIYGLTKEAFFGGRVEELKGVLPKEVIVEGIEVFSTHSNCKVVVATLQRTPGITNARNLFMSLDHVEQEFPDYKPHISLCYVKNDADIEKIKDHFLYLVGKKVKVLGMEVDNPWN